MFRTRSTGVLLVSMLAVAGLTGCASAAKPDQGAAATSAVAGTTSAATSTSAPTSTSATPSAVPVPKQLAFSGKTLDGKDFAGQSLAGKPAVLWFWAPWCVDCRAEAPGMAKVSKAAAAKVTFVGVAGQDQLPAMKAFVPKHNLEGFTHLADLDGSIWTRFDVTRIPTYAFVAADGTIEIVKREMSESEIADRVTRLSGA